MGGGNGSDMGVTGGGRYSVKGKAVAGSGSGPNIGQLNRDMANVSVDPTQEDGWKVIGKKSKNRAVVGGGKMSGSSTSSPKAWGQPGSLRGRGTAVGAGRPSGNNWAQAAYSQRPAGRGCSMPQPAPRTGESAYMAPPPRAVAPPLQRGCQWAAKNDTSGSYAKVVGNVSNVHHGGQVDGYDSDSDRHNQPNDEVSDDDDDLLPDSDDDLSDDYDSDASQQSHETRKNIKWFKGFFASLDKLSVDEINEPSRQWHCPACANGPGAIDWYTGLQPLMAHAKTKGATRAQLHRELAKLLEAELRLRGTSVIPAGEAFGKWRGLRETVTDREIVWPPMVVVMNTLLKLDEKDKWIGMGNPELLEYFSTYAAVKARHSYGPKGHRGMSLLIFEPTAMGYMEAERLHNHFQEEGTDRDGWQRRPVLFYPGGKRQLYGYLANKEDMEVFNQHCTEKAGTKYEIKSYLEMVVTPMKQMSEDNQQLSWLKHKVVKQAQHSKALEETVDVVSQKLRETMEENRIVRLRTKMQYEENKEEMDYQEQFFKEQMSKVQEDIEEKEQMYEHLLQEERAKAKQSAVNSGSNEEYRIRNEEIQRFIDSQVKGVKEFEAEREELISGHKEKKAELKRKYLEEEVELEKAFDDALTKLMGKYAPSSFETASSS